MNSIKVISLILLASTVTAANSAKAVFHGEISDTQCAMNVHSLSRSHEEMITKKTMGTDPASCARACVKRGGEWVLQSGEHVYHLKNQSGVEQFSARKVRVSGVLDVKTNTIDNSRIDLEQAVQASGQQ